MKFIAKIHSHCSNMYFGDKSRYGSIFQQVTHKGGEYTTNYIKIFQDAQALNVSVGKKYSEDQSMHVLLDKFHQGEKYSDQIAIHQADFRREGKLMIKNIYLFHPYRLTI